MEYLIGTRGSKLALAQSELVCETLHRAYPMHTFTCKIISTKGDRNQSVALDQMDAKGIFVKEIETALYRKEIDLAVHSMKDMPAQLPKGLCFTKTLLREDARDVLLSCSGQPLEALPLHAVIATGSKRRKAQLLQLRPDLEIVGIRGNIDTRIKKMEEQHLDGIVLAAAGLHRLQLSHLITQTFNVSQIIPACGQGALAIEVREEDEDLRKMIDALADPRIDQEVRIERAFLAAVHGGCHAPVGANCQITNNEIIFHALYGNEQGSKVEHLCLHADIKEKDTLAQQAAKELLERVGE